MVEKPKPSEAPSNLAIIGRYVLTPDVFASIESIEPGSGGELQLTEAGAKRLAEAECALAAVENEVLGALDDSQREVLYTLLLQAASGSDVSRPLD